MAVTMRNSLEINITRIVKNGRKIQYLLEIIIRKINLGVKIIKIIRMMIINIMLMMKTTIFNNNQIYIF